MNFMEWLDELFRRGPEEGGIGGGSAGQYALGTAAAEIPYIGPYLGAYLTGRDDLSDLTGGWPDGGDYGGDYDAPSGNRRSRERRSREISVDDFTGQIASDSDGSSGRRRDQNLLRSPDLLAENDIYSPKWKPPQPEQAGPVRPENYMDFGPSSPPEPTRKQAPKHKQPPAQQQLPEVTSVRRTMPEAKGTSTSITESSTDTAGVPPLRMGGPGERGSMGAIIFGPPSSSPPTNQSTPISPFFGQIGPQHYAARVPRPEALGNGRPELDPMPQLERSFWDRGGTGLLLSGLTTAVGIAFIVSNPFGWGIGLAGGAMAAIGAAMGTAGGVAGTLTSLVELGDSYFGGATAEQDAAANRATSVVLGISSPGGMVGGVAGTVIGGDVEGLETGAFWGGLGESGYSVGKGLIRMGGRELRFNRINQVRRNPVDMANWDKVRPINQQAFRLPPPHLRQRPSPLFAWNKERIELSHWIPKGFQEGAKMDRWQRFWLRVRNRIGDERYLAWVNRPWNLKPLWGLEHALIDPVRFDFIKVSYKAAYSSRQLQGLPRWGLWTPDWILEVVFGVSGMGRTIGAHRSHSGSFSSGSDRDAEDLFDEYDSDDGPLFDAAEPFDR